MKTLSQWRKSKKLSQEALGRQLGFGDQWKTYQAYESGRTSMPQDVRDKLMDLGFEGPFPEPGQELTKAELDAAEKRIVAAVHWGVEEIKRELTKVLEEMKK